MRGWKVGGLYLNEISEDGFEDAVEALEFANGTGRYSGSNSFHYSDEDIEAWRSEGFFSTPVCPNCILEAESPEDVDAAISVWSDTYTEKSFRPGKEKVVDETFYGCLEHPEVGIGVRESSYRTAD